MTAIPSLQCRLALTACVVGLLVALPATTSVSAAQPPGRDDASQSGTPGFYSITVGRSARDMIVVHYWSKGTLFRSETIVSGHPIITLVNGDFYYTWDDLNKSGYVVRRSREAILLDRSRIRPFGMELEDLIADGGEKIRSEEINGIQADVYRVTDRGGRRTVWVTPDELSLPLRLETYERSSGRTSHLDWVNWIPGLIAPDRFFVPPPDLDLRRFESYQDYLLTLQKEPVLPVPPLFHYLLRDRSAP